MCPPPAPPKSQKTSPGRHVRVTTNECIRMSALEKTQRKEYFKEVGKQYKKKIDSIKWQPSLQDHSPENIEKRLLLTGKHFINLRSSVPP